MDGIGAGVVESATIGVVKSNGAGGKIYYAGKVAGNLVVSVAVGAGAVGVGGGTAFAGASGQVYAVPAGMELAGGLGVVAGNSFVQTAVNMSKMSEGGGSENKSNKVDNLAKEIKNWVGKDGKVIANKDGDKVFISKDGLRRVRFDTNNPFPHENAHGHVERLINGSWQKSGPLFPKDVPQK